MNHMENDIFHDMQHVCKSGSVFCQNGEASSCNKCIFYESKVKELSFKNDECQREIHRLCQTVSCFTQQIAEKISEINSTLHDKIESISGKTLEQVETAEENMVRDANSFLEIQMVLPKEDLPETSQSGDLLNAPVDSYSLEDTMTNVGVLPSVPDERRKETRKESDGNRTCVWMVPDGQDQRTICGKEFPTIESLVSHLDAEHLQTADNVCLWEGCKRNELPFKRRRNLISHLRSHSGEKPFTCPQEGCGRAFSELCAVRLHMNTHSKATFPCTYPECRKVFNHKHTMLIHNRIWHRGEGTFKCPFDGCGMIFKGTYDLRKHSVRHQRAKPHLCKFLRCTQSFASKEGRDEHFAQHGEGRRHAKIENNVLPSQLESLQWKTPKENESTLERDLRNILEVQITVSEEDVQTLSEDTSQVNTKDSNVEIVESNNSKDALVSLDKKDNCKVPKALQNESMAENTVRDVSSFLEIQMVEPKEVLLVSSPSGDLVNGPVDSHSVEDTVMDVETAGISLSVPDATRKETEEGTSGNRTCMWMVPDGKDQRTTCGKEFPNVESLVSHCSDEHLNTAGKVCFWEGCKRNELPLKRRRNLISHFRSHSGEKPFTCPHEGCGRTFSELCAVRLHMNTHSNATFPCTYPGCLKVFNHKQTMLIHNRVRHRGEGAFKCPFDGCGKIFKGTYDLRKHSARHERAKPHVCKFPRCSLSFASKEGCDEHFAQHGEGRAKKQV